MKQKSIEVIKILLVLTPFVFGFAFFIQTPISFLLPLHFSDFIKTEESATSTPAETVVTEINATTTVSLPRLVPTKKSAKGNQKPPSSLELPTPVPSTSGSASSPVSSAPPSQVETSQISLSAAPTNEGILFFINKERFGAGLTVLSVNTTLSLLAEVKAKDMLLRQYFAHQSPDGKGPKEAIEEAGYLYSLFGENIIFGNFETSEEVVKTWMDSPGHKANILTGGFRETGIAVIKGMYQGSEVWMGVQVFGTQR